jgi:hypothetical protein
MALSPYMMRMMGSQMGGIAPGTISGLTQPMTLGVPAVQPLMGMAAMPAMGSGVPEDSMTKARRVIKEAMSDAPQGIDPDLAAILNQREARLAEQEKNIEDKGSVWDRLGRFSAALLTNESPFFSVGLGRAVATTLADEQRLREAAAQRREAIAQSREEIGMERIRQKGAGRTQAMEQLKTTISLASDLSTQEKNELEGRLKKIELEQNPQKFAAEMAKIRAEVGATQALTEERRTAAIKNLRTDTQGGGDTVFDRRYAAILRANGQEAADQFAATGKYSGSDLTPTQRGQMVQNLTAVKSAKEQLARLKKLDPGFLSGAVAGRISGGFSGSANAYDKALANLRAQFRKISRTTGEGSISDYETRLNNASLPERSDTPEGRLQALNDIQAQMDFLESSYVDILGKNRGGPAPVGTSGAGSTSGSGFRVVGKRKAS